MRRALSLILSQPARRKLSQKWARTLIQQRSKPKPMSSGFARQKLSRSEIPSFEERQGTLENPSLISQRSHFSRVPPGLGTLEQRAMATSKRQSYNKTRRVGSEPNLGQKAAERENKSKAQLSHAAPCGLVAQGLAIEPDFPATILITIHLATGASSFLDQIL